MLLDPREISIVPSSRRLYLRSDKTKSVPTLREGRIEFRGDGDVGTGNH